MSRCIFALGEAALQCAAGLGMVFTVHGQLPPPILQQLIVFKPISLLSTPPPPARTQTSLATSVVTETTAVSRMKKLHLGCQPVCLPAIGESQRPSWPRHHALTQNQPTQIWNSALWGLIIYLHSQRPCNFYHVSKVMKQRHTEYTTGYKSSSEITGILFYLKKNIFKRFAQKMNKMKLFIQTYSYQLLQ